MDRMKKIISVGIADAKTTNSPNILITHGLGSCVGIGIYDTINRNTGLVHIMLPASRGFTDQTNLFKFADTAIIKTVGILISEGARKENLVAKIAGGAKMFLGMDVINVGQKNIIATKKALSYLKIPIVAEDTGGNNARTVEMHSLDGKLVVRTLGSGEKYL